MNATLLGKILVFLNFILSLMLVGWALGIYTNRIDWPGPPKPVPGQAAQGELNKRIAELQHWTDLATRGAASWQTEGANLVRAENQRPQDQKWYADQLNILDEGRDTSGKVGRVSELVYDKGELQLDKATGRPKLRPVPLLPRRALENSITATLGQIDEQIEAVAKLEKEEERLTREIKTARGLIAEEQQAQKNALAEVDFLKPFRINRQVERDLLLKRQRSLKARVQELKTSTGVAAGQP